MKQRPAKLRRRLGIEWTIVALLASLAVTLLIAWNLLSRFDNLIYDQLSDLNRPIAAQDVLIVAIDEDSLSAYGKWPWSRDVHAAAFENIAQAHPKAVAFDILLSEPGTPEVDTLLAAAMAKNQNLFLPVHFVIPGQDGTEFDVKEPVSLFKSAASGLGHVNLTFDEDGVVRRGAVCFTGNEGQMHWPHLMEQIYHAVQGQASSAFAKDADCSLNLLFPYAKRGGFSSVPYSAVASGEVPGAFLDDKIVLIGATASGLGDQHPVPMGDGGTMAGVEIMANMLGTIRSDSFISPLPFWSQLIGSLIPMWILLVGFWRWKPRSTIFVSLGLIVLALVSSMVLLFFKTWFAPGAALVGLALVYPLWGWRRLQATSEFMDEQLQTFRSSKIDIPVIAAPLGPVDIVTGQAEELTHAIGHMRDLRRFISDALTNLPDPMFVTGLDGKVKFANKLAKTGLEDGEQDLALDDMLGRFVTADDLDEVHDYLRLELRPAEHDYVDFTSQDGDVFAMRRAPVLSDEGDLRGYIHYLADITDVANAAQEREEVLQLLSHDMRAPQAAILALLDGGKASDVNRRIGNHARRTLALADNFVGLARIKASEFEGEDILLSELVVEANDSLWPLANARDIKSLVDDRSEGAFVLGEPSSLHRSFVNLIDNAIKYSPDGGAIDIRIRTIEIDKRPHVSVSITDQGDGISEDMLENLFDRFTSDDSASKGSVRGAGLGLNFVAAVFDRHGGTIHAENVRTKKEKKGGARFTVLLPLAPDPEI